jgi:hypothetical protein
VAAGRRAAHSCQRVIAERAPLAYASRKARSAGNTARLHLLFSCCPWLTLCALAPPPPSRRWDNKTLITLAIWIGAVPYLIYEVTVGEFNRTDAVAQRPARAMLGSES